MDRIALISDIHGNIPALEAVLDDIDRRGITRVFCLGDLIGKGPHGDRVVDTCGARCEVIVRGNWDDGIATGPTLDPTGRWHQDRLGPERISFLGALPNSYDFGMSGRRIRLLHASPRGVYDRVHQWDSVEKLETMFESTAFTGYRFDPDVVGYGDIHAGYQRSFRHPSILFNVGSVGNPLDLPLACYAILEGSIGDAPGPFAIALVRIPYDIERAIQDAIDEDMPAVPQYADELRTARYRGSSG